MALPWLGVPVRSEVTNLGPLPLIVPLLEQMDLGNIIDRHVPPSPQMEYSHGQVLSLLLAARLCQPTALVNITRWTSQSGAELLLGIPADKANDDRLGRALDAFYQQRHDILASVAAHVVQAFELPRERLHYDPTDITFCGAYTASQPWPDELRLPPHTPSAQFPAAHITHGYSSPNTKVINYGLCSLVDDLGAVPIFGHTLSGNQNGQTAIDVQFQLLRSFLPTLDNLLMVSDRGTFSAGHIGRLQHAGFQALCSVPWHQLQALYDQHAEHLNWRPASYLSIEQQRRRDTASTLPREHYELALVRHSIVDPETATRIRCRVIFVYSTADEKVNRDVRLRNITRIREGFAELARIVQRGHVRTTQASITQRLTALLKGRDAARFFRWEFVALTAAERAALPAPEPGCQRPTYRLVYHFDDRAVEEAARYDGLAALLTTAAAEHSVDSLFTKFKQQIYVEHAHHQWKTPLAVSPVFLKSPQRVEALVMLLQIALTAYHLLQRSYRLAVPPDAVDSEKRLTTESILRAFASCPIVTERTNLGRVVHTTQLSPRQSEILDRLHFPTPMKLLSQRLPRLPSA